MTTLVWPAGDDPDPRRADEAPGGLHALHGAARVAADPRDLAVLDDVDPARVGAPGIAPRHRVVARRAAAALQGRAQHRIAQVGRDVQRRAEGLGLLRAQPLVVDAVETVRVDVALEALDVVGVVREHHHAPRRVHDVVVQLARQGLPELERVLVDRRALVVEIVGPDDRGVAAGVAAPEPSLLEHGDVGHPVLLGEVIGGGEAVPAAADDHRVVAHLRLRRAPLAAPALMSEGRLRQEGHQ